VASNYLLYNLISRVHSRTPEGIPIGHFNINLSNLTNQQASQIQVFLRQVLAFQLDLKVTT
jgi:hypothetical protein